MANEDLTYARKARDDEFYTQFHDIEKEMNAYLEFNPDAFRGKSILLPCDDPEWSNFTKFFAQKFQELGIRKLVSTSFAPNSKPYEIPYQPTLFEIESPLYDEAKTETNGKIFSLTNDKTGDGVINVEDLEWTYLVGDGDFRSAEIRALRDAADIIITNPPFSLFREFLSWLVEAEKQFVILGNMNAITYKEVFPLIKDNKAWLGASIHSGDREFRIPSTSITRSPSRRTDEDGNVFLRVPGIRWFANIDHGLRHQPLSLMTEDDNIRFSKHKEVKGIGYFKYENYEAIEVPYTDAIPSDYQGVMGVPISFLSKYNPDQFEIIGNGQTMANELGIRPVGQKFVDDYYAQGNKGQINAKWNNLVYRNGEKTVVPYQRILIKHKQVGK
jgi:hypothetical protein